MSRSGRPTTDQLAAHAAALKQLLVDEGIDVPAMPVFENATPAQLRVFIGTLRQLCVENEMVVPAISQTLAEERHLVDHRERVERLGAEIRDCQTGGYILKFDGISRYFGDMSQLDDFLCAALRGGANHADRRRKQDDIVKQGEAIRREARA